MSNSLDRAVPDDAQAMALIKKFRLTVVWTDRLHDGWCVRGWYTGKRTGMPLCEEVDSADLNSAIGAVVAKMDAAS
jgi:hypothetical protein